MSMDRSKLAEAIRVLRKLTCGQNTDIVCDAAEAHLATLPETKDHVVVGVREDGDVFFYEAFGEKRFTADKARDYAAVARKDWPHVTYTVVKVAA